MSHKFVHYYYNAILNSDVGLPVLFNACLSGGPPVVVIWDEMYIRLVCEVLGRCVRLYVDVTAMVPWWGEGVFIVDSFIPSNKFTFQLLKRPLLSIPNYFKTLSSALVNVVKDQSHSFC